MITLGSSSVVAEIARRSQALHGNKHVLPVAAAIAAHRWRTVRSPDVVAALGGQAPPNRVLEGLARLCAIGALEELPHPGRPHPRVFIVIDRTPYWDFVRAFLADVRVEEADAGTPETP